MTINKLHGKPIPMVSGYVAEYGGAVEGREGRATLCVAEAKDEREADKLLKRMVQGLKRGNPNFGHYHTRRYGGYVVNVVFGNGQIHTVYRNGQWILWLATDPHLPQSVVEEALEVGRTAPPPKPSF
ncbi:MAG: hypothetical protein ACE5KY_01905 [Candidatus Tectimicrobiota bacterium]